MFRFQQKLFIFFGAVVVKAVSGGISSENQSGTDGFIVDWLDLLIVCLPNTVSEEGAG
jgi:hypothetical protein